MCVNRKKMVEKVFQINLNVLVPFGLNFCLVKTEVTHFKFAKNIFNLTPFE